MPSLVPERPTLPPLRSLALPMQGSQDPSHVAALQAWQRRRRDSVSSPTTPHAPYPPPPPSIAGPLTSTPYPYNSATPQRFLTQPINHPSEPHVRLVLTDSFEYADAALVLCSTSAQTPSGAPRMVSSPEAVGPALERIRRPGTILGKGVRMHPYRIVHTTSTSSNAPVATGGTHYAPRR
ncbi:hypothetical protein BGW80DRAFT_1296674 [Lactifluus volemus]|nr:hypothetical protein BGW80DRAFT_1296674 [Lactifluus volemus]